MNLVLACQVHVVAGANGLKEALPMHLKFRGRDRGQQRLDNSQFERLVALAALADTVHHPIKERNPVLGARLALQKPSLDEALQAGQSDVLELYTVGLTGKQQGLAHNVACDVSGYARRPGAVSEGLRCGSIRGGRRGAGALVGD
eukprot:scaffold1971_cov374-Prasinococcus_capsulatus_cf.AAC.2